MRRVENDRTEALNIARSYKDRDLQGILERLIVSSTAHGGGQRRVAMQKEGWVLGVETQTGGD